MRTRASLYGELTVVICSGFLHSKACCEKLHWTNASSVVNLVFGMGCEMFVESRGKRRMLKLSLADWKPPTLFSSWEAGACTIRSISRGLAGCFMVKILVNKPFSHELGTLGVSFDTQTHSSMRSVYHCVMCMSSTRAFNAKTLLEGG